MFISITFMYLQKELQTCIYNLKELFCLPDVTLKKQILFLVQINVFYI